MPDASLQLIVLENLNEPYIIPAPARCRLPTTRGANATLGAPVGRRAHSSPNSDANLKSSALLLTPSLRIAARFWVLTVCLAVSYTHLTLPTKA